MKTETHQLFLLLVVFTKSDLKVTKFVKKTQISLQILKIWNSPTFMTWGSLLTRSFGLLFVLPLILRKFSPENTLLWFMFSSMAAIQMLFQMGFAPTFMRLISYARGGTTKSDLVKMHTLNKNINRTKDEIAWSTIESICANMRVIYLWMAVISFFCFGIIGSLAVKVPIEQSSDVIPAWIAWTVVLIASTTGLFCNQYSVYLQGMNKIALLRRWETAIGLCIIISGFVVLIFGGQLLKLVIFTRVWIIIGGIVNFFLCCHIFEKQYRLFNKKSDNSLWRTVWPPSWRSGIGVTMSAGLMQLTGVIYSQLGEAIEAASYWLGLRLITALSAFARAPFYSKIPEMARLWARNDNFSLLNIVRSAMAKSNWVLVLGFIGIGATGDKLVQLVGSNTPFPEEWIWVLLGVATLLERYSAMHIQLYSTTNKIIWHKVNGIGGGISIIFIFLFLSKIGVYAFPVAMILGQLCFTLWYSLRKSYQEFSLNFFLIDSEAVLLPGILVILYITVLLVI